MLVIKQRLYVVRPIVTHTLYVPVPQAESKEEAEKPSESAEKTEKTESTEKVKKEAGEAAESSEREEEEPEEGEDKASPAGEESGIPLAECHFIDLKSGKKICQLWVK